ncbi:DUF2993 domain-containing protein [Corynebacterium sp. 13CS0277]|uniref:LmeA family phospholipid-binding protein n=1 Tax=Corynebacterium sp. 13CS0277 TaxID=2071994 RepID=UPI000D02A5A6|nr:LmeA family phospholipid-binding protein [Corynebacterium sp. 13CS0277]PRQ12203.1 DUF2993 domain-containing protein [Corynebacterium sp. 13CS0277]
MQQKSSHRALKIILGILMVLLVLAFLAEVGVRWMITKQLKDTYAQAAAAEEQPHISFGAYPVLLGAVQKNIHHVDLTTPDTLSITYPDGPDSVPEIAGMPAAHVTIDGLRLSDPNNPIADTLTLTADVSDDFVLAQAQRAMADSTGQDTPGQPQDFQDLAAMLLQKIVRITDVTSNPADGTLEIEFTGGAASLAVQPVVADGQVAFAAAGASLFGIDMPDQVTEALTQGMRNSAAGVTGNLLVDDFQVTDGGLRITMHGTDVPLNDMS